MGGGQMKSTYRHTALPVAALPVAALLSAMIAAGCQDNRLYSWGSYEPSVRKMYESEGGGFTPHDEITQIDQEIRETTSAHKNVPPGKYAYLGYLYYLSGDYKAARQRFEAEKAAFPEGGKFMDDLIARLP